MRRSWVRRWQLVGRQRDAGASAVEYAILLATVCACLLGLTAAMTGAMKATMSSGLACPVDQTC